MVNAVYKTRPVELDQAAMLDEEDQGIINNLVHLDVYRTKKSLRNSVKRSQPGDAGCATIHNLPESLYLEVFPDLVRHSEMKPNRSILCG